MLSQRSIRREYVKQLLFSSVALIAIFSLILYGYIKSTLYDELKEELTKEASLICTTDTHYTIGTNISAYTIGSINASGIDISIVPNPRNKTGIFFQESEQEGKQTLTIFHPYNMEENSYVRIRKDISAIEQLLQKIFHSILILNFGGLVLVQIYAFALSSILTKPISSLSRKLSKMNENVLVTLDTHRIPIEFQPLGDSLNHLIDRLQKYIIYQKELFIGIAHELKTPLAVMKLKNEVLLIKRREPEKYIEAIELNIQSINEMNKMVEMVLEIGRQEGAQFETPVEMDVINYLRSIGKDFKLLARQVNKNLHIDLQPESLELYLQPTLLKQIIQNFLQNAVKFTPEGKQIRFISYQTDSQLIVKVVDEGPGIQGNIDIYAPFERSGNKSGAGLGLFLAKNAADTMGAVIDLKNREETSGAEGTLILDIAKMQKRQERRKTPR